MDALRRPYEAAALCASLARKAPMAAERDGNRSTKTEGELVAVSFDSLKRVLARQYDDHHSRSSPASSPSRNDSASDDATSTRVLREFQAEVSTAIRGCIMQGLYRQVQIPVRVLLLCVPRSVLNLKRRHVPMLEFSSLY
ncbi:hypothetical protein PHYPSEUDO_004073 [Phytophthora pseudosyringae]|uniref:Uncharacterized protein n=1 Tax=Phytophthora pseudosyringae TaxID=221518 RepID=A0A8T1VNT5_9STRA|nr:hypothetical protein PHYPSEUDO_004073 [Phytophthora pseudosyringae]